MSLQKDIQSELDKAEQARARGKEGQARVCARRAAGIAARDYFARQGRSVRTPSAFDVLNLLVHESQLPEHMRQAAAYLILRVDEEFKLPAEVDLIDEARRLCQALTTT